MNTDKLVVMTMISNPIRYQSRYRLYHEFAKHIEHDLGVPLWTVEVAFGNRPFEVTIPDNKYDLQLRTKWEMWHKEPALNLLVAHATRMKPDWEYIAWVDADIHFHRRDVMLETVQQLQHHPLIQMWSSGNDLNPRGRVMQTFTSFTAAYTDAGWENPRVDRPYGVADMHPGFAWAARRDWIETVGGLFDISPVGSGDHVMAWAQVQKLDHYVKWRRKMGFTEGYLKCVEEYQRRCAPYHGDIGVVEGLVSHAWHGKKSNRAYGEREKIMVKDQFDPSLDMKRDVQGLYALTMRIPRLRDDLRVYFRLRNEDSIDE